MKQWKPWEELTIQDNFMFEKVMRNEQLCRIFLELVLVISIRTVSFARHTLSLYARLIRLCLDCGAIPSIIAVTSGKTWYWHRTTKTFLNTRGTLGSESADVQAFMEYVNTNVATDGFAAAIAAEVAKVKANHEHRRLYMTLAMDMLEYVEEIKDVWFAEGRAEGKAEGKAEGRAEVARNLLHLGLSIPQIAEATGFSPAEIEALRTTP